jgi:DNA-binding XRE family transcriptional regulator
MTNETENVMTYLGPPPGWSEEAVGALFKSIRKSTQSSQRDLAQYLGITQAHLCRIERGKAIPSLRTFLNAWFFIQGYMYDDEARREWVNFWLRNEP